MKKFSVSFSLLDIEFSSLDKLYGFHFVTVNDCAHRKTRSLFSVAFAEDALFIGAFFLNIVVISFLKEDEDEL